MVRGMAGLTSAITSRALATAAGDDVDRDAQADIAELVGQRHLDQRHVDRDAADGDELRHTRHRDRHIVGHAAGNGRTHVLADEEAAVAKLRIRPPVLVVHHRAVGQEVHQFHVGRRWHAGLEGGHQGARRGAGGADEDAGAIGDAGDGSLGGADLVGTGGQPRVERRTRVVHGGGGTKARLPGLGQTPQQVGGSGGCRHRGNPSEKRRQQRTPGLAPGLQRLTRSAGGVHGAGWRRGGWGGVGHTGR